MSNVVALSGVVLPGEANEHLVAELEDLLAAARSGDLTAIAYCTVLRSAGVTGTGWVRGDESTVNALSTGLLMLTHRYAQGLMECGV